MSDRVIDYYLTMNSPWSYMGAGRLAEMAQKHGCKVNVFPTNIMEVFGQTGGVPLAKRAQERQDYRIVELKRWAAFLGLKINAEPMFFPAPDGLAAGAVIAAQEKGLDALRLSKEIARGQWELEQDFAILETVATACERAEIEMSALGDLDGYGDIFAANTTEAISRGVFGYPAYLYGDEIYWGQDRLDFLERALVGSN